MSWQSVAAVAAVVAAAAEAAEAAADAGHQAGCCWCSLRRTWGWSAKGRWRGPGETASGKPAADNAAVGVAAVG